MSTRTKRALLSLVASLGAATGLSTSGASAYQPFGPTNADNPLANRQWYVDWERFGMSQEQFLRYLTNNHLERIDRMVYRGRIDVSAYHGSQRRLLQMQARAEVGKDPYAWLPRVPAANREKARLILKLARNPQTMRVGHWTRNPGYRLRLALQEMEQVNPGALAFLYVDALQKSTSTGQCGNRAAGGPRDW